MKKYLFLFFFLSCCFMNIEARSNFAEIYPPVIQEIQQIVFFSGDGHGQFEGDPVAILTDGAAFKVHPAHRSVFENWRIGETVRLKVRSDFYWFKREHKFALYNYNRGESVNVMLVKHKSEPLKIVSSDTYAKTERLVSRQDPDNPNRVIYEWKKSDFRKVLGLSDGSFWVIKEKFDDFVIGKDIYIGAQGNPKAYYDFILIIGLEREAKWVFGRPQH